MQMLGIINGQVDGNFDMANVLKIEASQDGLMVIHFAGGTDYTVEKIEPADKQAIALILHERLHEQFHAMGPRSGPLYGKLSGELGAAVVAGYTTSAGELDTKGLKKDLGIELV